MWPTHPYTCVPLVAPFVSSFLSIPLRGGLGPSKLRPLSEGDLRERKDRSMNTSTASVVSAASASVAPNPRRAEVCLPMCSRPIAISVLCLFARPPGEYRFDGVNTIEETFAHFNRRNIPSHPFVPFTLPVLFLPPCFFVGVKGEVEKRGGGCSPLFNLESDVWECCTVHECIFSVWVCWFPVV